mgnify:CR=1 FL=1
MSITEQSVIEIPSDPAVVESEGRTVVARANELSVKLENYEAAAGLRADLIAEAERRSAVIDPAIESAHKAHKRVLAIAKVWVAPLLEAAKIIKSKLIAVDEEQRRIAQKKQLELEAAERERAEQEQKEVAALLKAAGDDDAAREVLAEPPKLAPVVVKPATPKVEGLSYRSQWSAEVFDLPSLTAAVVNGLRAQRGGKSITYLVFIQEEGLKELYAMPITKRAPIQAIQPAQAFLNSQATDFKLLLDYPGVKAVEKKV